MKRLQHWLRAQNQYSLQSPFAFELYSRVIAPRLDAATQHRLGLSRRDFYGQLRYKMVDYYKLTPAGKAINDMVEQWCMADGSRVMMMPRPHADTNAEKAWRACYGDEMVTLSVDLYVAGLAFTSKKLSKQHLLLDYHSTFPSMGTKLQLP